MKKVIATQENETGIWKITLGSGVHLTPSLWCGNEEDWPGYTTHSQHESWAKILASAWEDWLEAAEKVGMLTIKLSEHEEIQSPIRGTET